MDIDRYDDIRRIFIVRTIVECGSLQKAATALKVTPSALSQSLKSLETKLAQPLFIRERGKLYSTPLCLSLLEKAKPVFQELDTLFANKTEVLRLGALNLGIYDGMALDIILPLMRQLRQDHPGIQLNFSVNRPSELLKALRSGKLCNVVVSELDNLVGFHMEEVASEELGIFVSAQYKNSLRKINFIEQLGLALPSWDFDGMPRYFKRYIRQLGTSPPVSFRSDSFEVLRMAAAQGIAAAILPRRLTRQDRGEDLVEIRELNGKTMGDSGKHSILFIGESRCDPEEMAYLAGLVRGQLQITHHLSS